MSFFKVPALLLLLFIDVLFCHGERENHILRTSLPIPGFEGPRKADTSTSEGIILLARFSVMSLALAKFAIAHLRRAYPRDH